LHDVVVIAEGRGAEGARIGWGMGLCSLPRIFFWFLSWKWHILVHSGCYFSAQLRLLLYLQKIWHYGTSKT